jgi:type II secretory ATPase GspE/PulE/Tfp pilus assembly ATPase PilB-like protein
MGLLSPEQAVQAENWRRGRNVPLARAVRELEMVGSRDLAEALARIFDRPLVLHPEEEPLELEAMRAYGFARCRRERLVLLKGPRLVTWHPGGREVEEAAEEFARLLGGRRPEIHVAPQPALDRALARLPLDGTEGRDTATAGDTVGLFELVFDEALRRRASDVHLEPRAGGGYAVRLRVDGVLGEVEGLYLPPEEARRLITLILNRADMDPSGSDIKLDDGRLSHRKGDDLLDVRVSLVPTVRGPSLVLRLLARDESLETLDALGYRPEEREAIERLAAAPHGLLLMCGPTGSGKSTTLYAVVRRLQSVLRKVVSVEDPVEVRLPLVQQVQVSPPAGIGFHSALRAFLRHDPDVILVGEIRDEETARAAVQAARTGHLVLSTVHSNSAVDVPSRLRGFGIPPDDLVSELVGVVSQRLVRRLCRCAGEESIAEVGLPGTLAGRLKEEFGLERIRVPAGCRECLHTGYRGRTVVCEIMEVSGPVRSALERGAGREEMRTILRDMGFRSLLERGLEMVREGVTSLEEVARIVNLQAWARWGET